MATPYCSKLATFDLVIAVAEGGRFKTFAELMAYAKANPGKLNIGTPQIGTTQNLSAEYFLSASGLQAQIVPFNGTPPVITALRGGSLDAMVEILGPLMPQIKSNAVRPLALLRLNREIQTIMEIPDVKKRLSDLNLTAQSSTPEQVAEVLAADIKRWQEVITKAKIEKQ